jgi:hypothetical protein
MGQSAEKNNKIVPNVEANDVLMQNDMDDLRPQQ